ncbi:hypothetical protein GGI23_004096 [Coemansia sp. RSA 2559]|nr:hypothetical protein GGI23_004096 [Coemansia sp. RSA 2559]
MGPLKRKSPVPTHNIFNRNHLSKNNASQVQHPLQHRSTGSAEAPALFLDGYGQGYDGSGDASDLQNLKSVSTYKTSSSRLLDTDKKNSRRVTVDAFPAAIKRHLRGIHTASSVANTQASDTRNNVGPKQRKSSSIGYGESRRHSKNLWIDTSPRALENTASSRTTNKPLSAIDGQWSAVYMDPVSASTSYMNIPPSATSGRSGDVASNECGALGARSLGRSVSQQQLGGQFGSEIQAAAMRSRLSIPQNTISPSSSQTSLNYPSKLRDAMATLRFLRLNNNEKSRSSIFGESMASLSEQSDTHPYASSLGTTNHAGASQQMQFPPRLQSRVSLPHVSPASSVPPTVEPANSKRAAPSGNNQLAFGGVGVSGPSGHALQPVKIQMQQQPQELSAIHILSATTSLPSIRTSMPRDFQKSHLDIAKSQRNSHMYVPISPLEQRRDHSKAMALRKLAQASNNASDSWALREEDEDEERNSETQVNNLSLSGSRVRREPRRSMSYSAQTPHCEAVENSAREMRSSLRLKAATKEPGLKQSVNSNGTSTTIGTLSSYTATDRSYVSCDGLDESGGRETTTLAINNAKKASAAEQPPRASSHGSVACDRWQNEFIQAANELADLLISVEQSLAAFECESVAL